MTADEQDASELREDGSTSTLSISHGTLPLPIQSYDIPSRPIAANLPAHKRHFSQQSVGITESGRTTEKRSLYETAINGSDQHAPSLCNANGDDDNDAATTAHQHPTLYTRADPSQL